MHVRRAKEYPFITKSGRSSPFPLPTSGRAQQDYEMPVMSNEKRCQASKRANHTSDDREKWWHFRGTCSNITSSGARAMHDFGAEALIEEVQ